MRPNLKSARRTATRAAPQEPAPAVAVEEVPLEQIHSTFDTQARVAINGPLINEYAEAMAEGAQFPPVVLFRDAEGYWVGDGHHRCWAAKQVGFPTIRAEVQAGGAREAFLYACSANATHGLRRNDQDKRHVVMRLLADEEWGQWSDRAIARRCAVSHPFVGKLRAELAERGARVCGNDYQMAETRTVQRGETVYEMATARIGTRAATTAPANGEPAGVEEDEAEDLPAFLGGEGWTRRERAHAYALYLGLPAEIQPPVAALLAQQGICVPDVCTMLEHITAMDEAELAELVRLQGSADAYERSCAITLALKQPPPPHPRVMLLYDVRRELVALTHRVESAATRYPDLPGAAEVAALGACLAATANKIEALIDNLRQPKEA
jgi:hypothetical protein